MTIIPEDHGFVEVSHIDVDAGIVWIGDPCYIIRDSGETRPKDLGVDWKEFCDKFFERSGGTEVEQDRWDWNDKRREFMFDHEEYAKFDYKKDRDGFRALNDKLCKEFMEKFPFISDKDKGFANFCHDRGHGGMGTVVNTNYGDGTYPVYVKYGKNGRPSQILIDFGDE